MSRQDRSRQNMAHSLSLRLSRSPRGNEPATWSTRALLFAITAVFALAARAAEPAMTNDYNAVDAILTRHCLDCHAAQDPEAKLVMESFDDLMKGGESGAVIVPGKSAESLLVND